MLSIYLLDMNVGKQLNLVEKNRSAVEYILHLLNLKTNKQKQNEMWISRSHLENCYSIGGMKQEMRAFRSGLI